MNINDRIKIILITTIICIWCTIIPTQSQNGSYTIKSDNLLKLRNLQYEQAKRILRMQELKNEFDKLNIEQQALAVEIDSWIKEQAKAQNIDLTKSKFDLDTLKFVEIKQNE